MRDRAVHTADQYSCVLTCHGCDICRGSEERDRVGWEANIKEGAVVIDVEDASAQGDKIILSVGVHVSMCCLPHKGDRVLVCAICCTPDVKGVVGAARDEGVVFSEF